ncbi:MAG: MFS transporter [Alphaproteobacteria bacterium]
MTTSAAPGEGLAHRLYDLAVSEDDARLCRDIPDAQCDAQPKAFVLQVAAQAMASTGDALADPKVVLPWVLGAVGAPAFLTGLLVPIRESLALLPQILVGGVLRRFPVRKWFWAGGSVVEGSCILGMALVALSGWSGAAAGWAIVALLTVFALARGVASIAAKDTLGKTVSKGRRGRVGGYASTISGLAAGAVGLYLALSPDQTRPDWVLYAMLAAAGVAWFAAAATYAGIDEYPGATDGGRGVGDLVRDQVVLLMRDRELQKFLAARALMISTALSGPFYVTLAQREAGADLAGLGWLMVASGLAGSVSASIWGKSADRSSRVTMATAAALAGVLGCAVLLALVLAPAVTQSIVFYAGVLFVLAVAHAGVRIGRKTHVIDLAGGDRKAEYVALSNTLIGVLLLVVGGLTGALAHVGVEAALAALSVLALAGAALALTMTHAQA